MGCLELMDRSEAQSKKPGHAEYEEGTSQLLNCVLLGEGLLLTIIADSTFSSVKSPVSLLGQGFYFIGMAKTAAKK